MISMILCRHVVPKGSISLTKYNSVPMSHWLRLRHGAQVTKRSGYLSFVLPRLSVQCWLLPFIFRKGWIMVLLPALSSSLQCYRHQFLFPPLSIAITNYKQLTNGRVNQHCFLLSFTGNFTTNFHNYFFRLMIWVLFLQASIHLLFQCLAVLSGHHIPQLFAFSLCLPDHHFSLWNTAEIKHTFLHSCFLF